ncbi:hypothetical protein CDD83_8582 [Cordyceps sp. RAO-2017]|nr:hypothetical protein CDD83_8582 [Cordyceps sp. RAO-2017]
MGSVRDAVPWMGLEVQWLLKLQTVPLRGPPLQVQAAGPISVGSGGSAPPSLGRGSRPGCACPPLCAVKHTPRDRRPNLHIVHAVHAPVRLCLLSISPSLVPLKPSVPLRTPLSSRSPPLLSFASPCSASLILSSSSSSSSSSVSDALAVLLATDPSFVVFPPPAPALILFPSAVVCFEAGILAAWAKSRSWSGKKKSGAARTNYRSASTSNATRLPDLISSVRLAANGPLPPTDRHPRYRLHEIPTI